MDETYEIVASDTVVLTRVDSDVVSVGTDSSTGNTSITVTKTDDDGERVTETTVLPDTKTYYGTCTTASGTITKVSSDVDGFTADNLVAGTQIAIKFTNYNTSANPTLNINSTGAKRIYRYGTTAPSTSAKTSWNAGSVVNMTYDGSSWIINGWLNDDSDTYYNRTRYYQSVPCKSSWVATALIVGESDGKFKPLNSGTAWNVKQPILYANSSGTANSTYTTSTTFYSEHYSLAIAKTQSMTLTTYAPIYAKGTLNNDLFTPVSTTCLTQTEPTSEDGYYYLFIGRAVSSTNFALYKDHELYRYSNGGFKTIAQISEESSKTATNYMEWQDGTGLVIGDMTDDTLGANVLIEADTISFRKGSDELFDMGLSSGRDYSEVHSNTYGAYYVCDKTFEVGENHGYALTYLDMISDDAYASLEVRAEHSVNGEANAKVSSIKLWSDSSGTEAKIVADKVVLGSLHFCVVEWTGNFTKPSTYHTSSNLVPCKPEKIVSASAMIQYRTNYHPLPMSPINNGAYDGSYLIRYWFGDGTTGYSTCYLTNSSAWGNTTVKFLIWYTD